MTKQIHPVELLNNFMVERGLDRREIAELTLSSVRSVERWMQYGIPYAKWALLQAAVSNKKEEGK